MSVSLKKSNNENNIEDYLNKIYKKCNIKMILLKKSEKINDNKIVVPTINSYHSLCYNNYNINQLKTFAKNYKLKISGNKEQLLTRIYHYLYFSSFIIKIQKNFRMFLVNKYNKLHGPAFMNRRLCTNSVDFISMEPIEEINVHQFISYKDLDGFIYGFDITSLHNLFLKSFGDIKNPYNRNNIPEYLFKNIRSLITLSRILKININLKFEDDMKNVSSEKAIELRALSVFQNIDLLGNYSNVNWFISLNKNRLIKFMRELIDIWNYRAQIENQTKRNICPPYGDPFRNFNFAYINSEDNLWNVRKVILEVIEKLVNSGIDKDSKCLGACYVLGSLTLVNSDAAISLPWLFQSFNYF